MDFVRTSQNEVYLDAAGSALYTISQVRHSLFVDNKHIYFCSNID